jgi:hypothetical protein
VSIVYDYRDPERRWPCLGAMTTAELNAEWLRCYQVLRGGDIVIWPRAGHDGRLSIRVRLIEEELLNRQFLRETHGRFMRGELPRNGDGFERWRFEKFMTAAESRRAEGGKS